MVGAKENNCNDLLRITVGIEMETIKKDDASFEKARNAVADIISNTLKSIYPEQDRVGDILPSGRRTYIKIIQGEHLEWKCEFDQSISDVNNFKTQGVEIISPPLSIYELQKIMPKLIENLKESEIYSNETCGLHIHVDAPQEQYLGEPNEKGMEIPVVNLILQTYKNQDILRKILKCDRGSEQNPKYPFAKDYSLELLKQMGNISIAQDQDNRFKNIIEAWIDISGGDVLDDNDIKLIKTYDKNWINIFSEGTRYKCINIVPMLLNKKGAQTIENRMPDMELDANRIIANAYFTIAYFEACRKKLPMSPLLAEGKSPQNSVGEFLTSIGIGDPEIISTLTKHLPNINIESIDDTVWRDIFNNYQQKCEDCDKLDPPIQPTNYNEMRGKAYQDKKTPEIKNSNEHVQELPKEKE